MSDAARIAEIDARIAELEAKQRAQGPGAGIPKSQRRTVEEAKRLEAEARPVVPGPGVGALDRAGAAAKYTPEGEVNYLRERYGADNVAETREGIKIRQPDGKTWKLAKGKDPNAPSAELIGAPGDVAEAAVHGAKMILPTAGRIVGGPWGGALAQGAETALEQGVSAALPGEDYPGMSGKDEAVARLKRAAQDQAFNLGGEAIGKGISAAGGAMARARPGVTREASIANDAVAGKLPHDKMSVLGAGGKTIGVYEKETAEIEKWVREKTGGDLTLPAGARTGSQTMLLRDMTASGRNAGGALELEMAANRRGAQVADKMVGEIAKGQKVLNAETGDMLVNLRKGTLANLASQRSKLAGPLYREADEIGGAIQVKPLRETLAKHIEENSVRPEIAKKLADELEIIKGVSDKFGRIKPSDLVKLRAKWGELKRVGLSATEGVGTMNNQTRIAADIHDSIIKSLDNAAVAGGEGKTGEAARKLQEANEVWSRYSKEIDEYDTKLMARLEGMSDDAGPDQIAKAVWQKSEAQIKDYVAMVDKMDPSGMASARLRAQNFENQLVDVGGKAPSGKEALRPMSWARINTLLTKGSSRAKMDAFAGNDKEYLAELRKFQMLAERQSAGPRLKNSATAEKQFAGQALDMASNAMPMQAKVLADKALAKMADSRVAADVLSTKEGLRAVNEARKAQLFGWDSKSMRGGMAGLAKLLSMVEDSSRETEAMKQIREAEY